MARKADSRPPRDLVEMVGRLEAQLNKLEEFAARAFAGGEIEFLPEVANKLRLLIVRSPKNTPLLFEVAARLGVTLAAPLREGPKMLERHPNDPPPGTPIPLDDFFDRQAFSGTTPNGAYTVSYTHLTLPTTPYV